MKKFTALTARTIKSIGFHRDRGDEAARGLYLQVRAGADGLSRSWLYRYQSPITGKLRWMGLGPCELVPLTEARDLARQMRRLVTQGVDPIEQRRDSAQASRNAVSREKASRMTFKECADAYMATHLATFKSAEHCRQWRMSLTAASDAFDGLAVSQIDSPMIVKLLEPRWRETPVSASRWRARIEKVLDWATVHRFRQGDNPARWKGHLEHVFAALPDVEHFAAMPCEEVPGFLAKVRGGGLAGAAALEFLILTALRSGQVLGARWEEFDLEKRLWTVPAERMKKSKEHKVPLSYRATEILESLPRTSEFVFVSKNGKTRLTGHALDGCMAGAAYTVHGFRSTFRDWAGDKTNHDRETIEHALAHKLKDAIEAAYRRSTAIEKRRVLMQQWADFCTNETTSNVLPLRA